MSFISARCPICTSRFHSGNICCLPCGHTFHHACVAQWIQQSKTCPQCRSSVLERSIVKQLFFDTDDCETNETTPEDLGRKCEELSIQLEQEKSKQFELLEKLRSLKNECDSIADKYEREKTKNNRKLPQLESRNRQLEMMLQDQEYIQRQLDDTRSRLKACQFYELVVRGKGEDAEKAIDKYVSKKGDPESGQFLVLMRRQLEETKRKQKKIEQEIMTYEKGKRDFEKKEIDYKNLIQALTKELEETRALVNKNTPYNPRLKKVLNRSPEQRRGSFGFDTTLDFSDDIIDSAFKRPPVNAKFAHMRSTASTILGQQAQPQTQLPFPSLDESFNESMDLTIPKSLLDRVLAGSPKKKTNPMGIVPRGGVLSLETLKSAQDVGSIAPRPVKKPLKRKPEANSRTTNKNARISSFFVRTKSNSTMNSDDDENSIIRLD